MPFSIVRNDIAKVEADAIVNAANERLLPGGGVCGAIFRAAGYDDLLRACEKIGRCPTGGAVSTPAFRLRAMWVIHTVGPVWRGGTHGEEALLRSCYRTSLGLAEKLGARSVAFPLISAGIFGYPPRAAFEVASDEIRAFLAQHDMDVMLVVFEREAVDVGEKLFSAVESYIDDVYVGARQEPSRSLQAFEMPRAYEDGAAPGFFSADAAVSAAAPVAGRVAAHAPSMDGLRDKLAHLDASFSQALLACIDARGLTDAQVYKRANISRQLFAKIRKDNGYRPSKPTAFALALALELTLPETADLLGRAGLAISHSSRFDVIVEYFIVNGVYDIYTVNEVLFAFDQPLLGA